ncbi:transglutaminase-like putative cysteine protease [Paenibacillus sp. SORGH_AS306]|uniref:DUF4129 domain-containing transglutaminase family protein n=1 Tax=Paenibacillus sp. SORGH_AS_0306 TaxID=3041754 RepID=UPI00277FE389|nr:transglutaminase domain-containing protein [Paenibacillus sp. SORGH_AS_0306]MDQ1235095.1 transglutaminase-like putative cysteine protease [Paenibacillus sp. SORGH_AS_0306]
MQSVEAGSELPLDESSDVEKKTVKQQVKMLSEDNVTYPVLFGAYTIGRVTDVDGGSDTSQLDWRSNPGEIHWSPTRQNRKFPESYSLVSRVPIIPVKELEKKTFNQLYADKSLDQYLQVPSELPDRVRNLAKEVTASGDTPYEKVELLQQYLQNNFAYTNNPDLSKKKSRDFVDSFLFEVKEGYCDYYSTAMVMMARSLDIPARWVKGYAPGQASGYVTSDYFPDGATEYTVTNADAHSWAEIYFADYGWVPIEATPGFDMPMVTETVQTPSDDTPTPEPEEEEQTPEEEETATPVQDNEPAVPTSVIWIASSVILAWAAVMIIRYRRELSFMIMRMRQGEALTPQQKIMAESKRWLAWMKRHGMDRRSYETLRESVSRWEEVRPDLAAQLTPLLELFEKAKYSPDQITEEEWTSMQHHLQNLRKRWRKRATK